MIGRRSFITGLISLVAAPAIVRAGSLMPVKAMIEPAYGIGPMMFADFGIYGDKYVSSHGSRLLLIDRALVDLFGPEFRAGEEQRLLA